MRRQAGFVLLRIMLLLFVLEGCRGASDPRLRVLDWSTSGQHLATKGLGRYGQECLSYLDVEKRRVTGVTVDGAVFGPCAWSESSDKFYHIVTDVSGGGVRALRASDSAGRLLHEAHLPFAFDAIGLVCTREGHVVIVDAAPEDRRAALASVEGYLNKFVIRVFAEDLKKERVLTVRAPIYNLGDIKLDPVKRDSIIALGGERFDYNVVSVNAITGDVERVTAFGIGGPLLERWEVIGSNRPSTGAKRPAPYRLLAVLWVPEPLPGKDGRSLFELDPLTGKYHTVVDKDAVGGDIKYFDVRDGKAIVVADGGLYSVDLAKRGLSRLLSAGKYAWVTLSPGAKKAALIRDGREVVVVDLSSGKVEWVVPRNKLR